MSLNNKLIVAFAGITTIATVMYSGFAGWQLYEIHSGAQDTHDLAVAAKRQADKAETISNSLTSAVGKLGQQAKAAQDSANAIQRQTEIGARPWLELSEIALTGGITINMKGEANSLVHVVAKNIGKTPAKEVSFMVELGERNTEHQEILRLCTMKFPIPENEGKYGQVLFPDKALGERENRVINITLKPLTLVERKQVGTGYSESLRIDKNGPPSSQKELIYPIPSSVIGCIQYKSFTSDVIYYTGFIYEIFTPTKGTEMFGYNIYFDRKTGKANHIPPSIPQENGTITIPLDWLRLTENQGWGNDIVK